VQRELESLAAAGLVTVTGRQPEDYQANRGSPIFEELRSSWRRSSSPVGLRAAAPVLQQPRAEYAVGARAARLRIRKKDIAALCRKYGVKKLRSSVRPRAGK
jgi:hypothetical protein